MDQVVEEQRQVLQKKVAEQIQLLEEIDRQEKEAAAVPPAQTPSDPPPEPPL